MELRKMLVGVGTALTLSLGFGPVAQADVYTMSNEVASNQVIAFDILPDGNLVEIGRFDTGGTGTGAVLGNQNALTTDASDRWLFVVNPGDGSLTSFRLQPDGLEFVNRVPSGGFRPISVTVFGTLVYVVNEGDPDDPVKYPDNISGFRFGPGGVLEAIPNSTRPLSADLTAPAQIGFNKSGTVLLITEKATNTLTTYVMQPDDTPALTPVTRNSAVPTPFGFEFGDRDFVFITEANNGGTGVVAVYRVARDTGVVSNLVDMLELGGAACWTVLSNDQTIGYATNTAGGTVSLYRINFDGTLDPFFAGNPHLQIQTGAGPRDAVLTQNNHFFYTLNPPDGEIRAFRVTRSGNIRRLGTVAIPISASGLMAR
jgi:6-phosphogluconolactonase (cycloisomerase 2 family)